VGGNAREASADFKASRRHDGWRGVLAEPPAMLMMPPPNAAPSWKNDVLSMNQVSIGPLMRYQPRHQFTHFR
jgi:hypothetical protein